MASLVGDALSEVALIMDDAVLETLLTEALHPLPDDPVSAVRLADAKIVVKHQSYHREDLDAAKNKVLVVSNLRKFEVALELQSRTGQPIDASLEIKATLLYEDGTMPVAPEQAPALLSGTTRATFRSGRCALELKIKPLTQKHHNKRFCVLIEPADAQLAAEHPELFVKTVPLKTVTKLVRSPNESSSNWPAPAGEEAPPQPILPPRMPPPLAPPPPPLAPPPPPLAPLPPVNKATAVPPALQPNNMAVRIRGGIDEAAPAPQPSTGGVSALSRAELETYVRQQREQIELLITSNQAIFDELRALRAAREESARWLA